MCQVETLPFCFLRQIYLRQCLQVQPPPPKKKQNKAKQTKKNKEGEVKLFYCHVSFTCQWKCEIPHSVYNEDVLITVG